MKPLERPPIEASDDEIARALESASAPALMMSIIHMTGDLSGLEGEIRPKPPAMLDLQCELSPSEQSQIRKQALEAIRVYRSAGCPKVAAPAPEALDQMLAFMLGEDKIEEPYRTLLLEELNLDGSDTRRIALRPEAKARLAETTAGPGFRVAIIGAGMSGLLLGIRLAQAGIDFVIYEKNAGVGGTWFENQYPGCRVDIASHCYSYSFEEGPGWNEYFGRGAELQSYFERIAADYDLLSKIEFGTAVNAARFDADSNTWQIDLERGGEPARTQANVLVSAVGQLNRPKIPDVPGRETFAGPQMHTAEWDPNVSWAGKRVAVVGSGASAFQMVPELAKTAKQVTVFQRTPQWMFPNPGYHDAIDRGQAFCLEFLPGYARWFRILSLWPMTDKAHPQLVMDPEWDGNHQACGPVNQAMRENLSAYIESQVEDPNLLGKVLPQYPPFGTRVLQDNGAWLSTLQQDTVELVAEGAARIEPDRIVSASGDAYEADLIVWATGFHADRFLWPMEITGLGGQTLAETWQDAPSAYLGITVPAFPNFFCLYGPNTNVAHTVNVIFISECQARYIGSAIELLLSSDHSALDCKPEVASDYETRLDAALEKMVWCHPSVHSFYRSESGRVVVNMPWSASQYWSWTRQADPADFRTR